MIANFAYLHRKFCYASLNQQLIRRFVNNKITSDAIVYSLRRDFIAKILDVKEVFTIVKQKVENAVYTAIITLLCYNSLGELSSELFDPTPVGLSVIEKVGRIVCLLISFGLAGFGLVAVCFIACLIPALVFHYCVDCYWEESFNTIIYTSIAGAIITIVACVIIHLFQ